MTGYVGIGVHPCRTPLTQCETPDSYAMTLHRAQATGPRRDHVATTEDDESGPGVGWIHFLKVQGILGKQSQREPSKKHHLY